VTQRAAFELAIRRITEVEPGLTLLAPLAVGRIRTDAARQGRPIRVTGLQLTDATPLPADLVIDAGGRRTPVPAWLAQLGVDVPCKLQACGAVYYARYYRLDPAAGMSIFGILGVREQIDGLALIGLPGDHGTYGLGAFVPDDDEELKVLRHH
jgi:hypothetical protein